MPTLPTLDTLAELARPARESLQRTGRVVACDRHWQVPAATERAGWHAAAQATLPVDTEYVGFPWASLIDGMRGDASMVADLLGALRELQPRDGHCRRRVTVAQHIHAMQYADLFRCTGITDVFWSHAATSTGEIPGLRIHPFPLFPAQTAAVTPPVEPSTDRRWLANFIGAFNPRIYLSNVREVIFADANPHGDLLVVKRDAWHFDRAVYHEQVAGQAAAADILRREQAHADEYRDAIRDSWFTLCPSGSGPNSIRIFESLCLGSIPVVLTRDLRLAGPPELWRRAAVIEDDSEDGYRRAIDRARLTPIAERLRMLRAGRELLGWVAPSGYARWITDVLADRSPER